MYSKTFHFLTYIVEVSRGYFNRREHNNVFSVQCALKLRQRHVHSFRIQFVVRGWRVPSLGICLGSRFVAGFIYRKSLSSGDIMTTTQHTNFSLSQRCICHHMRLCARTSLVRFGDILALREFDG